MDGSSIISDDELAGYVADVTSELCELTGSGRLPLLHYLLSMARDEARALSVTPTAAAARFDQPRV